MSLPTVPSVTRSRRALLKQLGALGGSAWLGSLATSPAAAAPTLMLSNALLHPLVQAPIPNGRLLIENGRIAAIGGPQLQAPSHAKLLDLQGQHVYPGLISPISALGLVEINAVQATVDSSEVGELNPNARAVVAVNADSELIAVARSGGVLTVHTAPRTAPGGLMAGTSALLQLDGWHWEQMALVPELALHIHMPAARTPESMFGDNSAPRAQQQRVAQQRLRQLDEAFALARAYAQARAVDPKLPIDSRWEALRSCFAADPQARRPVWARADDRLQIRHALELAQRHELRLVLVGGAEAALFASTLRTRQIPVVVAQVNRLPLRRDDPVDTLWRLPASLAEAGVSFCIGMSGSEGHAANERNLAFEAGRATAHGLSADEALKAITLYPAQILGVSDRLGSLQVGCLASLFVSSGSPLDIRSEVLRTFVQGRELPMDNRHTRLRDRYEERLRR
ncbi:amidohydrolase family protein [Roseateles sp. BYS180W]|uniref:Amidohydrolase family protein n=1 Tax=Roseateles rivi TaxID=3299028 RepID=A0ABW7FZM4_9BURK